MLIKTRGIVLRSIKYSETSLIVDIYTEARGLQKYIVSGVRSKKARTKASLLQVMTLLDLVAYYRENRDLHRIKEMKPAYVFHHIPFHVLRGAVGLFMAEVARKTIREAEAHPELFEFLFTTFRFLDKTSGPVHNLHLHFLAHLSSFLGFIPGDDFDEQTPYFDLQEGVFVAEMPRHAYVLDMEESALLYELLRVDRVGAASVKMTAEQRRRLLEQLLLYYRLHIENLPEINAHRILHEVLG